MSGHIRLPNITGKTPEEQAQQMKSYLTQLAGELNWALGNIQSAESAGYAQYRSSNKGGSADNTQQKAEDILKNFNEIKGLIIKSADIVNAYYDEINTRLEGLYVAQSEYGTFVEKTTAITTQNSKNTTTNYENIQLVTGSVTKAEQELSDSIRKTESSLGDQISETKDSLEKSIEDAEGRLKDLIGETSAILVEVQAHIKSGELDHDENGIPIYGVEVGQTNTVNGQEVFNRYARFTADRLSFYDAGGNELAYISGNKLYISNVEIKGRNNDGSFKIGGYVDTVTADGGVITKWEGT